MNTKLHIGAVFWAVAGLATPALGQQSAAPIRMLVGLPAGSAADAAARALGDSFRESLGQTVVVDNRPGAGGRLAAELLKKSSPDGATLLLAPMGTTIFFPLYVARLPYDPWKDFAHISQVATLRLALAVTAGTPAKSVSEYLAWAKVSPGKASFGSAGAGTPPHFMGMMIGRSAGLDLTHIAYKGGPPMVTDLAGGHIPAGVGTITDFGELHRTGKVRILATGGAARLAILPDVATFREQGYDIEGITWLGLHAPAGTPRATVDRLASAVATATRKPDIQERFFPGWVRHDGHKPGTVPAHHGERSRKMGAGDPRLGFQGRLGASAIVARAPQAIIFSRVRGSETPANVRWVRRCGTSR